jgi:hypothetical protein
MLQTVSSRAFTLGGGRVSFVDAGWSRFHLRVRRIYSREGVRSIPKDWCRISPQIFAEDAGRNLSKPRPGGLFGTLRGLTSREVRTLHAAISTHHAQEMQKQDPPRILRITRIKPTRSHRGHRGAQTKATRRAGAQTPALPVISGFSYLVANAGSRWDWKVSRRLLISSQFARFHQAARYSGRRLLYLR